MSTAVPKDPRPVDSLDDLIEFIALGEKTSDKWVVGVEHEKIGWCPRLHRPPRYDGPEGIEKLFKVLESRLGWVPILDDGFVIGLSGEGASITLEPGGQLELSGAPLKTLAAADREIRTHLDVVRAASEPLGIQWSAIGLMPWGEPQDIPLVPKSRYPFLEQYVRRDGRYGLHMMRQTATAQVNLDFKDEHDAFRKMRVGLFLQPIIMALFANSPIVNGVLSAHRSFRAHVWTDVAPSRCRLPGLFFDGSFTYHDYVQWAVDIPLLFIHKNDVFQDAEGVTFRQFMTEGLNGHRADMGDWSLHLSTLFPDVRLKQHLEVRGADMCSPAMILALAAFHVGIFYNQNALDHALEYFDGWCSKEWDIMRAGASVDGLNLRVRSRTLAEHGLRVLDFAHQGLALWEPSAQRYLQILRPLLESRRCPADELRRAYDGKPETALALTRIA